ncbi:MAG: hypothetical protein Q7U38_15200, partial [Methylobacter sp.]|nr:hypothetical protein [Methylobacter sp.]
RYSGNPDMAANYLQKLRKHISLQPIAVSTETPPATRKRAYFRIPTYSHYILNVVLFIINYWFLTFMASTWQP